MCSRGQLLLNLAISSVNTENETLNKKTELVDMRNKVDGKDSNLQNEEPVKFEPEKKANLQQISSGFHTKEPCDIKKMPLMVMSKPKCFMTEKAEEEMKCRPTHKEAEDKSVGLTTMPSTSGACRKRKMEQPVATLTRPGNKTKTGLYRRLHLGEESDAEESDNLFGDCSSEEYCPDENYFDDSDYQEAENPPKKRKLLKKRCQKIKDVGSGRKDENVNKIPADTDNMNEENDEEQSGNISLVVGDGNLQAEKRKKKNFSPKLKVTRKRQRNPNEWKRYKRMINRERGHAYENWKGVIKPAKTYVTGELCPEKCRLKCSKAFTLEEREIVFSSYYKLDVNAKNCLIFNAITKSTPKRKRTGAVNPKTATYKYNVSISGKQTQVCKRAFVNLYQISMKKVDLIQNAIKTGLGAPVPDKRGQHKNRPNKTPEDVAAYILQHISSFPAEESHYSRNKNIHKKYLSPLLSIPVMHKLYLEKCTNENVDERFKLVKECTYRFFFNNEFNLSFGYPKSDTCSTCDAGSSNEEHIENYKAAFEAQKTDRELARNSTNTVYITLDLQQTMPLPRLSTSKAFYLRQMWFYNLGIHIVAKNVDKTICSTWTENQASKGSNEIVSSLLRAIEVDETLKEKDHLIIWTDSCSGQNKNFLMLCVHQFLVGKGQFKKIDHKFPEVGHSYLDSDRDFGRIEKILRKHQTICTPEQYREVIASSNRKILVIDMENHFRNTEDLPKRMKLFNKKKDLLNEKVHFRDGIKWFEIDSFGSYLFKESYDPYTPFKKVILFKDVTTPTLPKDFSIPRIFKKTGSISKEKLQNLKEQLCFVPDQHKWFYEQVFEEQEKNLV